MLLITSLWCQNIKDLNSIYTSVKIHTTSYYNLIFFKPSYSFSFTWQMSPSAHVDNSQYSVKGDHLLQVSWAYKTKQKQKPSTTQNWKPCAKTQSSSCMASLCSSITLMCNYPFFPLKECLWNAKRREWAVTKRVQHCPPPVLLFLYLSHVHEVVLGGLPMSFAQVKLDRVLACKSPVAKLALVHGPTVIVIVWRGWRGFIWGQRRDQRRGQGDG